MKKGKQYKLELPYIFFWKCDDYWFIQFYKKSWISILQNRVNGNCFFTITYNRGNITFEK